MRDVVVSDIARSQLRMITDYLSTFGRATAESFVLEYNRKWQMHAEGIVEFPSVRHPQLARMGYRVALVKNYLMLYRVTEAGEVLISHIFHQSQDYARLVLDKEPRLPHSSGGLPPVSV